MTNFGISDLRLVTPEANPNSSEARALATHGEPILEATRYFATLPEAVADCVWVAATSARKGGLFRTQNVLSMKAGIALAKAKAEQGKVAFVFGPEDHGLTNDEVSLCHYLLNIPADPSYDILNLSQAVMLTLFQWYEATVGQPAPEPALKLATAGELEAMYLHLEEALRAVHFVWGEKGPAVFHAIRHLLNRAEPTVVEHKLLHGLARQLLWYVKHHPADIKCNQPPEEEAGELAY